MVHNAIIVYLSFLFHQSIYYYRYTNVSAVLINSLLQGINVKNTKTTDGCHQSEDSLYNLMFLFLYSLHLYPEEGC